MQDFIKSFTFKEVRDIIISVLVLGFIFAYVLWPDATKDISSFMVVFAGSILIVGLAFVLHELAHKYVAIKKKCSAHYVAWPAGLLMALVFGFLGFVFAAPGAVQISNRYKTRLGFTFVNLTQEDMGKIAIAGPLVNIFLALIFKIAHTMMPIDILGYGVTIGMFLATFNLLPVPPLDGSKVFAWSRIFWGLTFVGSIVLLFTLPNISLIWSLVIFVIVFALAFFVMVKYRSKTPSSL